MPKIASLESMFWEKVQKVAKDECWNWTGAQTDRGYGCMRAKNYGIMYAHRLSWIINIGPIPKGKLILHKCDNRKCVNPKHLYVGTQSDNMYDRAKRNPKGQGMSKFYEGEVWVMKKLYHSGKVTQLQISKMFKCTKKTVSNILNGRTLNFKS